jgi:RNA polymerase sigma factor (sigma-70 family)
MRRTVDLRSRVSAVPSDAALASRVRAGDQDAFAQMYDRFGPACYGLALRVLGDETLAQDAVQDVFVTFWRQRESYDPAQGRLATWLLTLAHRRAVDIVRREQAHRSRRAPVDVLEATADPTTDVADQVENRFRATRVRAALTQLTAPQREALSLAYYAGFTQPEIADRLDIPLGTVKSRMSSGMKRLRDLLIDHTAQPASAASDV